MKRTIKMIIILLAFIMASPQALLADDTEIYGSVQISVKPNVLIIFDTSGSMGTADIPSEPYDPATDYCALSDCNYGQNKVYNKSHGSWVKFADDIADIGCQGAKDHMLTRGWTTYKLKGAPNYKCNTDTTSERYRLGNYLNFLDMPGVYMRKRTDVAKETIKALIDSIDNVNFGLMRFNEEHGGKLVKPMGTSKADLLAAVDALPASGWTPLAETLAEAGLYFAGKKSWFNKTDGNSADFAGDSGIQYTSPMQYTCQKNYIILMTDGFSTHDKANQLWKTDDTKYTYINGDYLGGDLDDDKEDCDKYESGVCKEPTLDGSDGTDFLDDVAKYLYDNDLNASLGAAGDEFEKQNVTLFTIGFQTDFHLLADAAANGGGEHFMVYKAVDLAEAFESIISLIIDENAVFVAPVVPVNRMNRAFAGDFLYLGFFRPKASGNWAGNLKKYGLDENGQMVDSKGDPATDSAGRIVIESTSYWTPQPDGPDVEEGGVGYVLNQLISNRTLLTYIENPSVGSAKADLTDAQNKFLDSNSEITDALLGNPAEGKTAVINRVHGVDKSWKLGDILHSEPKVLHYWTSDNNNFVPDENEIDSYIFVGANDGMLHVFGDADGKEKWGFIPPDQLDRLKLMMNSDTNHDYFVDGSPMAYERWDVALDDTNSNGKEDPNEAFKLLFFGERRGGENYYALDISDPLAPRFLYKIDPLYLSDTDNDGTADLSGADLGESWVKPELHKLFFENDPNDLNDNVTADVFLMAGGYDTNQDFLAGEGLDETGDDVGRAVFAMEVESGNLADLNNNGQADLNFNGSNFAAMTHSIIDISGFDTDGNGYMNVVYAGDLGGHLFAFRDSEPGDTGDPDNIPYAYDGVWEKRKLFEITNPYGAVTLGIKFMYSPDAVRELFDGKPGEYVYLGTGDRSHPDNTDFTDALYAIKNPWDTDTLTTPLTIADLYDATDNLIQDAVGATDEETRALREAEKTTLEGKDGWFIRLEHSGEKVVSTPRVFAGVVYFTTYEPPSSAPPENDPCLVPTARGTARLYAVDYKTGVAVHQFDESNTELNKSDRSVIIGTSVPSAPVIAVHESGAKIFIGVQGGVKSLEPVTTFDIKQYYWRQLF